MAVRSVLQYLNQCEIKWDPANPVGVSNRHTWGGQSWSKVKASCWNIWQLGITPFKNIHSLVVNCSFCLPDCSLTRPGPSFKGPQSAMTLPVRSGASPENLGTSHMVPGLTNQWPKCTQDIRFRRLSSTIVCCHFVVLLVVCCGLLVALLKHLTSNLRNPLGHWVVLSLLVVDAEWKPSRELMIQASVWGTSARLR